MKIKINCCIFWYFHIWLQTYEYEFKITLPKSAVFFYNKIKSIASYANYLIMETIAPDKYNQHGIFFLSFGLPNLWKILKEKRDEQPKGLNWNINKNKWRNSTKCFNNSNILHHSAIHSLKLEFNSTAEIHWWNSIKTEIFNKFDLEFVNWMQSTVNIWVCILIFSLYSLSVDTFVGAFFYLFVRPCCFAHQFCLFYLYICVFVCFCLFIRKDQLNVPRCRHGRASVHQKVWPKLNYTKNTWIKIINGGLVQTKT